MNLLKIYDAGAVRRYHTKRTIVDQTIADHSWGVCVVLMWLHYPDLPSAKLFQFGLLHDAPELVTGDIPAPAKWRSPALREALTQLEGEVADEMGLPVVYGDPVLSFADNAELVLHCLAQARMGNAYMLMTARRGVSKMKEIVLPKAMQERGGSLIAQFEQELA